MVNLFLIDKLNITIIGKDADSQVILQLDEDEDTILNPGTDAVVSDLDGNICVMNLMDFRNHVLKSISLLSEVDSLFRDLLDCDPLDSDPPEQLVVDEIPKVD
jgi:hypothetical protein